jgi:hypothetical protein
MEYDLIDEVVEGFFPFQNMHLKDIYAGEVGKIVLKAVI